MLRHLHWIRRTCYGLESKGPWNAKILNSKNQLPHLETGIVHGIGLMLRHIRMIICHDGFHEVLDTEKRFEYDKSENILFPIYKYFVPFWDWPNMTLYYLHWRMWTTMGCMFLISPENLLNEHFCNVSRLHWWGMQGDRLRL